MRGDLSKLTDQQRLEYYNRVCTSIGVNPLTRPFEYITLNNRLQLYARRDATDQLRKLHGISIDIVSQEFKNGLYTVHARASDRDGRHDEDLGSVPFTENFKGESAANAILKCVTKAKRQVTLSICGLGFLDETEVAESPGAKPVASIEHDPQTGEVTEGKTSIPYLKDKPDEFLDWLEISCRAMMDTGALEDFYRSLAPRMNVEKKHPDYEAAVKIFSKRREAIEKLANAKP